MRPDRRNGRPYAPGGTPANSPTPREPRGTRRNFRHRLSNVSSWLCRPTFGLYTVKCLPRFCSASRQLSLLPRTWAGGRVHEAGRWGLLPSLPRPCPAPAPPPPLGSCPRGPCSGPAAHLVRQVEAVVGARQLQRPGVSLVPLQAAVHADLQEHMGLEHGGGGAGLHLRGGSVSPHLVEDHLPVLGVPGGQEDLLALLIDLIDARSQVCAEDVERTRGGETLPPAPLPQTGGSWLCGARPCVAQ